MENYVKLSLNYHKIPNLSVSPSHLDFLVYPVVWALVAPADLRSPSPTIFLVDLVVCSLPFLKQLFFFNEMHIFLIH